MKNRWAGMLLVWATLATTGCKFSTKPTLAPVGPKKPIAAGTVLVSFSRKVKGPLDLVIDGTRIPVQQGKKAGTKLFITGLAQGKHRYFLSSPLEAFGFDQGEFEVFADKGTFVPLFAQSFKAVLYGKPEPMPAAPGLPGVTARLDP